MRSLRGIGNFLFDAGPFRESLLAKEEGSFILSSDPVLH
jgi:hypothetical protein